MHRRGLQTLIERSGGRACLRHYQTAPHKRDLHESAAPAASTTKQKTRRPPSSHNAKPSKRKDVQDHLSDRNAAVTPQDLENFLKAAAPSKEPRAPPHKSFPSSISLSEEVQKFMAEDKDADGEMDGESLSTDFVRPGLFVELRRFVCMLYTTLNLELIRLTPEIPHI